MAGRIHDLHLGRDEARRPRRRGPQHGVGVGDVLAVPLGKIPLRCARLARSISRAWRASRYRVPVVVPGGRHALCSSRRMASLTWRVLIRIAPLAFVAGCEATVPFHPPTSAERAAPEPTDDVSQLEDSLSPSSRARFESRRIDVAIVETSPSRRGYVFRDARGPVTENDFVERYREATSAHDLDGDRPHPTEDLLGGAYLTGLGLGGFVSASTLDDVRGTSNVGAIALGSALSANVRETAAPPEFSVEGEQAKAARDDIIEPCCWSPTVRDGSDVEGQEAVFHRRVQEADPPGGRRVRGDGPDRRATSSRGPVLVASGRVAPSA
jgi:hypothetical protein